MKYFIDTEFIDMGHEIDLISIGVVAEDGRELYLQSVAFEHRKVSQWVKDNVFPRLLMCPQTEMERRGISGLYRADRAYHKRYGGQCLDQQRGPIHNCPWRTREQLRNEVSTFITEPTEFWGWCAGYDFVVLCQLFDGMMDLPQGWPHYIRDIQYLLDEHGILDDELPQQQDQAHNALADARYLKQLWGLLQTWTPRRKEDERDRGGSRERLKHPGAQLFRGVSLLLDSKEINPDFVGTWHQGELILKGDPRLDEEGNVRTSSSVHSFIDGQELPLPAGMTEEEAQRVFLPPVTNAQELQSTGVKEVMSQQPPPRNATTPEQKREIIERVYALWLKNPEKRLGELFGVSARSYGSDYDLIEQMEWLDEIKRQKQ